MKKLLLILPIFLFAAFLLVNFNPYKAPLSTGAPPYHIDDSNPPEGELDWLKDWIRPEGPAKVGLQVGHWKASEAPDELHRLRTNTGASGGGKTEWEVNYAVAEETKKLLEPHGIVVELLPATVPEKYWADVFVAVHADGNPDPTKTGFKAAIPRRDLSGKANNLLLKVRESYEKTTNLTWDEETITRNMRGYYAFSYWRYNHTVHPMTTSLILETGFLTSPGDRKLIVDKPELAAQGLAEGIIDFLTSENLL